MKFNKHKAVPLGLMLFLAANASLVQGISVTEGLSNPTVCQWLSRNGNKLYLCGASSDVDAMVKEARYYQKPAIPIIDTTQINPQINDIKAIPLETAAIIAATFISSDSQVSAKAKSNPLKSIALNLPQPKPVALKKASSKGFMVQSIGEVNEIKPKLIAALDKDFQILKRKNRISMGIYSQYKNALRRQRTLSALGIQSELIDRSLETTVQAPPPKKKALNPIEPKKSRIEKPSPANVKGFLVASVDSADSTLSLLQAAKDKHFQVLRSAPFANRVSLGVYNTRKFALIRQRAMLKHGIISVIIDRAEGLNKGFASRTTRTENVVPLKISVSERSVLERKVEEIIKAEIAVIQLPDQLPNQDQLDRVIQLISSN
ncbi:MAG: hypothetical protein JKY88_12005 [Pseudomonadales bacterium]|nr:hypothetical protein [Pseudomonadales bacterium]